MHDVKRKNFAAAHPGVPVPMVEPLSQVEAEELRNCLAKRLRVPAADGLLLVRSLGARSVPVEDSHAGSEHFQLPRVLWSLRINPRPIVYLNWYRFDEIDRMRLEDLSRYFGDIWYPSSDDLDVFDDSCEWILSISHSGQVSVARLSDPSVR